VALWADGYAPALDLMRRCLPPGLMRYLQQRKPPQQATQPPNLDRFSSERGSPHVTVRPHEDSCI